MAKRARITNSDRSAIIDIVKTPLGFFVLVILVVEVMFGLLASMDKDQRGYLVAAMMIMLFVLVAIVTFLAYCRPEALAGNRPGAMEKIIPQKLDQSENGFIKDLGNFPDFFSAIIEAIDNAPDKSEIQIASDYVGFGMFNASKETDRYRGALQEAKERGCTIKMLALGCGPYRELRSHVPPDHERWFEVLKTKEEFKKKLDALTDRTRKLKFGAFLPNTWTRASQLDALIQAQLCYEQELKDSGIEIKIVQGPLPLYLWLTELSAIWVLCPLEPRMRFPLLWSDVISEGHIDANNPLEEHGFLSCDKRLVQKFQHLWRQYSELGSVAASISAGRAL